MDNIKDDRYYIQRIIENIDVVLRNTDGLTLDQMKDNEMLMDSVIAFLRIMALYCPYKPDCHHSLLCTFVQPASICYDVPVPQIRGGMA